MRVSTEHLPQALVVALDGEIDLANASFLQAGILEAAASHDVSCVLLDLREVEYLDSAGVELLFRVGTALEGGLRVVVAPGSIPERVLGIVALDDVCDVHATLDAALAACA